MTLNASTIANAIKRTLDLANELGVTIPAGTKKALATAVKNLDAAAAPPKQSIEDAALAAIKAGNDPLTDPGVLSAIIDHQLTIAKANGSLSTALAVEVATTVNSHYDALVTAFKTAYSAAGEAVATSRNALAQAGFYTLDDPRIAKSTDPAVQHAAPNTYTALETLRRIDSTLNALRMSTGKPNPTISVRFFTQYDIGQRGIDELREYGSRLSPWQALDHGYAISLATPAEALERVNQAQAFTQDAIDNAHANSSAA